MTLVRPVQTEVSNTAGTVFTATGPMTIQAATACNSDGTSATLTVWIVPDGATRGDEHLVIRDKAISGSEVILSGLFNHNLVEAGDMIDMQASVASTVTVTISGRSI